MFNPYINNRKVLYTYLTVWGLIFLFDLVFFVHVLGFSFKDSLIDEAVSVILFATCGISFWYPAQYITFERNSIVEVLWKHLLAGCIASLFINGIGYLIVVKLFSINRTYEDLMGANSLIWRFFGGVFFYTLITTINYVIIYYNNYQEKELRESQLNTLVKEAELRSLKYQINPHFIFNSLNSISSLTISDPKRAREMTIKLSDFMRGTLSINEKQTNRLKEELKNVYLYLDIEKVRFEDKFEFINSIKEGCGDIEVPNMILQPLFENAIKHGVYESLDKIIIQLRCEKSGNYMKIDVINNYDREAAPRKGEGIGLVNIKNRLKLFYDQDNLLNTTDNGQYFQVTIYIPLGGKNE